MELGSYFLFLQEQIKNNIIPSAELQEKSMTLSIVFVSERTIKRHHHHALDGTSPAHHALRQS